MTQVIIWGEISPLYLHMLVKPKVLGWFWIITSIITGIIMALVFKSIFNMEDILPISIVAIGFYGVIIIQFMGGLRLLKRSVSDKLLKNKESANKIVLLYNGYYFADCAFKCDYIKKRINNCN